MSFCKGRVSFGTYLTGDDTHLFKDSVGLYLFHQWSKRKDKDGNYAVSIVMRDVEEDDPPFKTFYMWYLEDKTISALEGLRAARENIATRLLWYAKEEYLVCVSKVQILAYAH